MPTGIWCLGTSKVEEHGVCTTEVYQLEHVLFKGEWKSTSGTVEGSPKGSKGLSNLFRGAVQLYVIGSRVVRRCLKKYIYIERQYLSSPPVT